MRLQGYAVWETLVFLLNALLFVLIGLQLPLILDGLSGSRALTLLGQAVAVSVTVTLTRIALAEQRRVPHPRARPPPAAARAARRTGACA